MQGAMQIAPHPQITIEELEATNHLRCRFCPHPADTRPNPPQLPLADAPWIEFRCGCRVHTVCYAIRASSEEYYIGRDCLCCGQSILRADQRAFLDQRPRMPEPPATRVNRLWAENEVFREEVKALAKEPRKIGALHVNFLAEKQALVKEWKEAVAPSIGILKHTREVFTKRLQEMESRKKYFRAHSRYKSKVTRVLETYAVEPSNFETRDTLKEIPKIRCASTWSTWRHAPWYIFKVRI
jgi:hypothetical protein